MSHYCNRHSQSPIRYKTNNSSKQPTSEKDNAKININIGYNTPFDQSGQRNNATPSNLRGQQTESTNAAISPLLQQKLQQYQTNNPYQFQNYVSQEGVPLRPNEIDQMKLRQEIAAREHELKLLAQMDYLLDLIKNIDQDRNVDIDQQKIEEIEKLKSNYESINEDIQNLSFSQNLHKGEEPKRSSIPQDILQSQTAPQYHSGQNIPQIKNFPQTQSPHQSQNLYQSQNNPSSISQSKVTPLGYSSVGGCSEQQQQYQQPNIQGKDEESIMNSLNREAAYQTGDRQYHPEENQIYSSNRQPINQSRELERSNNTLQQSQRSNVSNKLNNQQMNNSIGQQQDNSRNNGSLLGSQYSQQEQVFNQRADYTQPEHDLRSQPNQPYLEDDKNSVSSIPRDRNESQKKSIKNSINSQQSNKGDMVDEINSQYSQQITNGLISSLPHSIPGNDQLYSSQPQGINSAHSSNQSSARNPQQQASYQSIPRQNPDIQQMSPHQSINQQGNTLTGSYSLKNPQKNQQNLQQISPSQKLEQSIQTSMQLLNSQQKPPSSAREQADKSLFEQQLQLYERQIKSLLEENECLKKNIADSQNFKKPIIDSKEQPLYSSIQSKVSRGSFSQPQNNNQIDYSAIQELKEALQEKEADIQILISNITLEKDQNKSLQEENEFLKTRLINLERDAQEMLEQRQKNNSVEVYNSSKLQDENISQQPQPNNQSKRPSEIEALELELLQKKAYYDQKLKELDQQNHENNMSNSDQNGRLYDQIQNLQDELSRQHAAFDEYVGRYNQNQINNLKSGFEEKLEDEQIKNMMLRDLQDSLGETIERLERNIQDLQKQLDDNKKQYQQREQLLIEENKQKVSEVLAENTALVENNEQLKTKDEDSKNQINFQNQEMQQLKQRYIELEVKKENLTVENNELKASIDQLEQVRNQEIGMKEDSIKHITQLQVLLEQKHNEIDHLTQERDSIKAEYDELQKSLNEMESNLQAVQENFIFNRNQHEQLKREQDELKQAIVQSGPAEDEEEEIRQSINELKKELNIKDEQDEQDESRKHSRHYANQDPKMNDLHASHQSKHSHHHSSLHNSARLQKDNNPNVYKVSFEDQQYDPQQSQQLQENNEYPQDQVDNECDDCNMCFIEEVVRQNEQLKQQLLLKEKEIIELKTNPSYYAKAQSQLNPLRSPYSGGKGQFFLETNDQIMNNRQYESPLPRQSLTPNSYTSPSPIGIRNQIEQQGRASISNSKAPEQISSSKYQHTPSQQQQISNSQQQIPTQQQYQSYSVLQSEIEHLQKIFDKKCKEVDSWKKTYQQFYEN